jgi:membrane-associated phospholipid phosphatase
MTRELRRHVVPPRLTWLRGENALVVTAAALGAFGALLAAVMSRRSEAADIAITLRLQGQRHRSVALLMEAVSWPGFPPQSRLIPPLAIGAMLALRLRTEAAFQFLAWGTALVATVVKAFVHRPRPLPEQVRVVLVPLGGSSFPSGHVLTYVGVYGFMAVVVHGVVANPGVRWPVSAGLVGLIGLIGPSRIYLGHHWPTDVAASYTLGLAYLVALLAVYRRVKVREL